MAGTEQTWVVQPERTSVSTRTTCRKESKARDGMSQKLYTYEEQNGHQLTVLVSIIWLDTVGAHPTQSRQEETTLQLTVHLSSQL